MYFVYSFITFRSEEVKVTRNSQFLNHYLYRDTFGRESDGAQMVFMDKQTRGSDKLQYQSSFLAGIVALKSRDSVFTLVSDASAVYGTPLTNYFGLFKL